VRVLPVYQWTDHYFWALHWGRSKTGAKFNSLYCRVWKNNMAQGWFDRIKEGFSQTFPGISDSAFNDASYSITSCHCFSTARSMLAMPPAEISFALISEGRIISFATTPAATRPRLFCLKNARSPADLKNPCTSHLIHNQHVQDAGHF